MGHYKLFFFPVIETTAYTGFIWTFSSENNTEKAQVGKKAFLMIITIQKRK
jgi:hypothetical protein